MRRVSADVGGNRRGEQGLGERVRRKQFHGKGKRVDTEETWYSIVSGMRKHDTCKRTFSEKRKKAAFSIHLHSINGKSQTTVKKAASWTIAYLCVR